MANAIKNAIGRTRNSARRSRVSIIGFLGGCAIIKCLPLLGSILFASRSAIFGVENSKELTKLLVLNTCLRSRDISYTDSSHGKKRYVVQIYHFHLIVL